MDLRSVKEGKLFDDVPTKDRVKHLRGSSSSSISPTERERSASDLINLFNQRSSTPKHRLELQVNNHQIGVKNTKPLSSRSPGISPVTSPVRIKPQLGHFREDKPTQNQRESPAQHVVRRKPKKSNDRPRMQNRPKSLVLTSQISLEEMIKDHYNQAHSDTEIDDEVKLKSSPGNQRRTVDEKPAKKSRQIVENVREMKNASLIVRDIDIDDSVKSSDSKKSWLENTVIFTENPSASGMWIFLVHYHWVIVHYYSGLFSIVMCSFGS